MRPGPGSYAFLHLSFQEYLAAAHASTRPELARFLADRFGQSWWKEATLLALGQGSEEFARAFFTAVLARPDADPAFLELCLDDALMKPMDPFVAALRGRAPTWRQRLWPWGSRPAAPPPERQAFLLRILGGRRDPAVLEAARGLVLSAHPQVAGAARELLMKAGEVSALETERVDPRTGIVFVRIPAGTFWMGSPREEQDEVIAEWVKAGVDQTAAELEGRAQGPRHQVTLLGDFWLARYPVTNEQYARFLDAHPDREKPERWEDRAYNQPRQPVVGVTWHDAVAFCRWAGMRLPREAEWEHACRAGTTTRYWSGDTEADLARVGWYAGNSGGALHAVGELPANPWGLYDMHGNMWEWCADAWQDSYLGAPGEVDPAADPAVGDPGAWRVGRGGGFGDDAGVARSACRSGDRPSNRWLFQGFRVLLPLAPPAVGGGS